MPVRTLRGKDPTILTIVGSLDYRIPSVSRNSSEGRCVVCQRKVHFDHTSTGEASGLSGLLAGKVVIDAFHEMNAIVPPILSLHRSSEHCPRGQSAE